MSNNPRVAIVYLSFHCEPYLEDVFSGLKRQTYPKENFELVIVDNPHPSLGSSVGFINDMIRDKDEGIPHVTVLPQTENLGFSGGNNVGIQWALEHGFEYVYLHNNDGFLAADAIKKIVDVMESDKSIGVAQSLILLHPDSDLINSSGNSFHYLGFGYCNDYRVKISDCHFPVVRDVGYASGAGVLLRADLLKKFGLWDADFFMYHEDCEYSFRLRAAGFRSVLASESVFFHKYQFSRSMEKFYFMARNRWAILLMFFKVPTLVLLAPMIVILEAGLWFFSFLHGWSDKQFKVYKYWLSANNLKLWLKKRRRINEIRVVGDRTLLKYMASEILFQESSMKNPLLIYVGNPLMKLYYFLVVRGLIWW